MARVFAMDSARLSSLGMGEKGRPIKSVSKSAMSSSFPLSARCVATVALYVDYLVATIAGSRRSAPMTVKLELKPEVEAGLIAQAQARGLSLEAYLGHVLQERASTVLSTQGEAILQAKQLVGHGGIHLRKRSAGRKSLAQLFAESPFKGLDLKFERDPDTGRPVNL
jgi:hypothetical protein